MEEFDLVDDADQVIGVTTKEEAHTKRLLHRVVAIFVFDSEGRLLLQEHKGSGGKYDHSVGGHMRKGETYDEAARREGYEELQLTSPLAHVVTFYSKELINGQSSMHYFGVYETHVPDSWTFTPHEEVETVLPMKLEDVIALMNASPEKFTVGFMRTLKAYIHEKNLPYEITY